jgi:hypothetical protein
MKPQQPHIKTKTIALQKESMVNSTNILKLMFAGTGFMAISAIAIHIIGIIPLSFSAPFIVMPAFLLMLLLGIKMPKIGKPALHGWVAGVIAVTIYDCSRIPFMMAGWDDFIPMIGNWIFAEDNVHGIFGYLWRYIGNGGGLGMAFVILVTIFKPKKNLVLIGTLYGLFVFLCLDITLIAAPNAQEMMFPITTLTFIGSLVGHLVYGTVLGFLTHKMIQHNRIN